MENSIRINESYILALNIPVAFLGDKAFADPLWAKDLLLHLDYIESLTLFCPILHGPPPSHYVSVSVPRLRIVTFEGAGRFSFYAHLGPTLFKLWREIGLAKIVHTGVAGWPLPIGWFATAIAVIKKRFIVISVESSFWRAPKSAGLIRRASAWIWESMARACLSRAHYAGYTQEEYRNSLPSPRAGGGVLAPASWIDAKDRIEPAAVNRVWDNKGARMRFLFPHRLTNDKGCAVLLDAVRNLRQKNINIEIDVIGSGPERDRFVAAAEEGLLNLLEPVPYGAPFFAMLDRYHGVLVPLLSDEQPRIIYDAAARALPIIGSDRPGLRDCVLHGETGYLVEAGSASALADTLSELQIDALRSMGIEAHRRTAMLTHQLMHETRARLISEALHARN